MKAILRLILPPLAGFFIAGYSPDEIIELLGTITGIVTLVPLVTQLIKGALKLKDVLWFWGFIKAPRFVSWFLSLGLVFVSWYVGWGFEGDPIWILFLKGLGAGLAANGYYTITKVKAALLAIMAFLGK